MLLFSTRGVPAERPLQTGETSVSWLDLDISDRLGPLRTGLTHRLIQFKVQFAQTKLLSKKKSAISTLNLSKLAPVMLKSMTDWR